MANVANYAAAAMLNTLNRSAVTAPAGAFVGLSTGVPTAASLLGEIGTAYIAGYTRVQASWNAAVAGTPYTCFNLSNMTFGTFLTACNISGIGVVDALGATGAGNLVWYGTLANPRAITAGDSLIIAASALTSMIS
jgi:hypothetical protein